MTAGERDQHRKPAGFAQFGANRRPNEFGPPHVDAGIFRRERAAQMIAEQRLRFALLRRYSDQHVAFRAEMLYDGFVNAGVLPATRARLRRRPDRRT